MKMMNSEESLCVRDQGNENFAIMDRKFIDFESMAEFTKSVLMFQHYLSFQKSTII